MLELTGISKSFGAIQAVRDVSLIVPGGEIFGLLGPNGAGKTTTVGIAVGLLRADTGHTRVCGADPHSPHVRRRLGVAPQRLALYEDLTALENLRFFAGLYGVPKPQIRERVSWALDLAGLSERSRDRVKTYSGGMQRRLNLVIALVHRPDVVLLDEPTVGVDPQSRNVILERIVELKRQGCCVIYTTHYMEEAQRICDRVGIIDQGQLLAVGRMDELIRAHAGRDVVVAQRADGDVRMETDDAVATLVELQRAGGLIRFEVQRPTLETVFLNLTGRQLRD